MPWTTPPDFVDGPPSPDQDVFNIIPEDIEYLMNLGSLVYSPMIARMDFSDFTGINARHWYVRHRLRYLYLYFVVAHDDNSNLEFRYNGTTLIVDSDVDEGAYEYTFDLDVDVPGLVYGNNYMIELEWQHEANATLELLYLEERETPP